MTLLDGAKDAHPLLQPGHLQPSQGCILRLFDSFELGLEEVELELFVGVMVFELVIHADVAIEAPVPVFVSCFLQGGISHRGALEEFQKPVGSG